MIIEISFKTYMNELDIPYITAKQYVICLKQIKQFESENYIKYSHAF